MVVDGRRAASSRQGVAAAIHWSGPPSGPHHRHRPRLLCLTRRRGCKVTRRRSCQRRRRGLRPHQSVGSPKGRD